MIHPATIYFVGVIGAATLAICVGIVGYARGYKAGVAYCMAQLEPLEVELLKLRSLTRPRFQELDPRRVDLGRKG